MLPQAPARPESMGRRASPAFMAELCHLFSGVNTTGDVGIWEFLLLLRQLNLMNDARIDAFTIYGIRHIGLNDFEGRTEVLSEELLSYLNGRDAREPPRRPGL